MAFKLTVAYPEGDVHEVGTFDDLAEADKRFEAAVAGLRSIRWDGITAPPLDPYGH